MRLDNAGPRTWLLAAVAAWAVIALLLAAVGMGGHVGPIKADEDLRQPLPPVPPATARQLGPMDQYAEIYARPLFSSDRKPRPFTLRNDDGEAEDSSFDYVLTSVLITPRLKMAIIQPADGSESVRVKLDEAPESHPAWRLVELAARSAVFEGPEGRRNMALRVYDGEGGASPTAMGSASGAPPGMPEPPRDAPPEEVVEADGGKPDPEAKPAMTPESQMEAIRQRIQARRAALREQAQNRETPPRQPMPPDPPSSPPPNPPAESR